MGIYTTVLLCYRTTVLQYYCILLCYGATVLLLDPDPALLSLELAARDAGCWPGSCEGKGVSTTLLRPQHCSLFLARLAAGGEEREDEEMGEERRGGMGRLNGRGRNIYLRKGG